MIAVLRQRERLSCCGKTERFVERRNLDPSAAPNEFCATRAGVIYARNSERAAETKTSIFLQSRHATQTPHVIGVRFRQGLAANGGDRGERSGRERAQMQGVGRVVPGVNTATRREPRPQHTIANGTNFRDRDRDDSHATIVANRLKEVIEGQWEVGMEVKPLVPRMVTTAIVEL
jgi:hypothetical protein